MLPVVRLQLVVPELIAHTHNAFGSLLLCVAHHDKESVELLPSGHWLEELLKLIGGASKISFSLLVQFDSLFFC